MGATQSNTQSAYTEPSHVQSASESSNIDTSSFVKFSNDNATITINKTTTINDQTKQ